MAGPCSRFLIFLIVMINMSKLLRGWSRQSSLLRGLQDTCCSQRRWPCPSPSMAPSGLVPSPSASSLVDWYYPPSCSTWSVPCPFSYHVRRHRLAQNHPWNRSHRLLLEKASLYRRLALLLPPTFIDCVLLSLARSRSISPLWRWRWSGNS